LKDKLCDRERDKETRKKEVGRRDGKKRRVDGN
jgi:hypothetical protein